MKFSNLPEWLIILVVICGGVFSFFIFKETSNPCTFQIEQFRLSTKGVLYPIKIKNATRPPTFSTHRDQCKASSSLGGCQDFFTDLRLIQEAFGLVSKKCESPPAEAPEVLKQIEGALELLIKLSILPKEGILNLETVQQLSPPEVAIFCKLKQNYLKIAGVGSWQNLSQKAVASVMSEVSSDQSGLGIESLKKKSILGLNCSLYL